ncbi:hypothetical protein [Micromonospora carbonacea]|uniref:Uncharacterized protein n=1 Tax=Micromonospora carbonacea TaxID=47853 RepID=A0A1C5AL58_9ACTN|nr:hypothetical protein [Micromonospora carbonacea]SCF45970.1 hypothetical protein GA0070563_11482 [Micromonospora carbonacea]
MSTNRTWLASVAAAIALAAGVAGFASPAAAHARSWQHSSLDVRVAVGVDGVSAAFGPDQKRSFGAASRVDAVLIEDAAHDLALHRNAPRTNDLVSRWALLSIRK